MSEQPSDSPVDVPTKSMMTACEVITWIAFRRAIPQEQLGVLFKVTVDRWSAIPADTVLDALEARAGISGDGPFYAIRIGLGRRFDHDSHPSRYIVFTEKGPTILQHIRRVHRKETGRLLSYADLARLLREEIAADDKVSEQIEEAKAQLRDRAAGGLLVGYGTPVAPDGTRRAGALIEALPATLFMHPAITLTEWDTVHGNAVRPLKEWWGQRLPRFEDMQFKTAEVLALWPPHSLPGQSKTLQIESRTAIDAIAWIAYQDQYDGRYYAAPGDTQGEGERRHELKLDRLYPTNSGLPDFSNLAGLTRGEFEQALATGKYVNDRRWTDAEATLRAALLAGKIKMFDEMGHIVPTEFWLANNFHSPRVRTFRLRANDLRAVGLVPDSTAALPGSADQAHRLVGSLPPELANDPRALAAFHAMCHYARECITLRGKPPKRDDAAQAINKETTYPVRRARDLYRYLPKNLRNPARTTAF